MREKNEKDRERFFLFRRVRRHYAGHNYGRTRDRGGYFARSLDGQWEAAKEPFQNPSHCGVWDARKKTYFVPFRRGIYQKALSHETNIDKH